MKYKLKIIQPISETGHGRSNKDVFLFKELELDFPPCVGLMISDFEFGENRLTELYYDMRTKSFTQYNDPHKVFNEDLKRYLKESKKSGWSVEK